MCGRPGLDFETWDRTERNPAADRSPETRMSPRITLTCYAAKAAAGAGLGSHGAGLGVTNRTMTSDPQSPQRRPDEVETVSQFPQ